MQKELTIGELRKVFGKPVAMKEHSFRIVDHGPEHEQYFQGHGTAFTKYTHCYTGVGSDASEALRDALDHAAMSGEVPDYLISDADASDDALDLRQCACDDDTRVNLPEDWHWYVSVDFKV